MDNIDPNKAWHSVTVHEEDQSNPVIVEADGELIVGLVEELTKKWVVSSIDAGMSALGEAKKSVFGSTPATEIREFRFKVSSGGAVTFDYLDGATVVKTATFNVANQ